MAIRLIVLEDLDRDFKPLEEAVARDRGTPSIDIVGRVRTPEELYASIEHKPDVVLIDHWVPLSGQEQDLPLSVRVSSELTRRCGRGETPIRILWSTKREPETIYSFMAFGGHNYVDKTHENMADAAIDAIRRTVCDDERWTADPRKLSSPQEERLVNRYRRLIALLAAGVRTREIAEILDTDEDNVNNTTGRIARAFGLTGKDGNLAVIVPEAAERAGYHYVPYKFWHLAPDNHLWPGEEPRGPRRRPPGSDL
jgi:DNA-binding NarL/FixJ family response regulator